MSEINLKDLTTPFFQIKVCKDNPLEPFFQNDFKDCLGGKNHHLIPPLLDVEKVVKVVTKRLSSQGGIVILLIPHLLLQDSADVIRTAFPPERRLCKDKPITPRHLLFYTMALPSSDFNFVDHIVLRGGDNESNSTSKISSAFKISGQNSELGGRATASKWLRRTWWWLKGQTSGISDDLSAILITIQNRDLINEHGKREIALSRHPQLLEGLSLNPDKMFESIVRAPLRYTVSRESLKAHVTIPALMPGINFVTRRYPVYCIRIALGVMPDFRYTEHGFRPDPGYELNVGWYAQTTWFETEKGSAQSELELVLPNALPNNAFTLILSVGICFGAPHASDTPQEINGAGSAKVLAVG